MLLLDIIPQKIYDASKFSNNITTIMQTKHFTQRITQRSIRSQSIQLLKHFGRRDVKDKIRLSIKNCDELCQFIDRQINLLEKDKPCYLQELF